MSDLQLLFLVLLLLYGWECACWIRRGAVAFRAWVGEEKRVWEIVLPGTLLGNEKGGFVFAHPLPPLGALFVANQFPLSLSPDAFAAYVSTGIDPSGRGAQTGRFFRYDDVHSVQAKGRKLFVNSEFVLKAAYPALIARLALKLEELRKLAQQKRSGAIERIVAASFDAKAVESRWQEFRGHTRALRWLVNTLVIHVFIVVPAALWFIGLSLSWLWLLCVLAALTSLAAVQFRRAHLYFYPAAADERFAQSLLVFLWPTTAMRAHDLLSRPLFEEFHPLALAKVFCNEAQFRQFAGAVLRDIRHPREPVCPSNDDLFCATERYWRKLLQLKAEQFLRDAAAEPDGLCAPPRRADEACQSFCPRCEAQFTTLSGVCSDCGGLTIIPFETATEEARAVPRSG